MLEHHGQQGPGKGDRVEPRRRGVGVEEKTLQRSSPGGQLTFFTKQNSWSASGDEAVNLDSWTSEA